MRRLVVLAGLLLALAVSSCGPQHGHLWVTPGHRLSACVSNDCGEWSVTLNWQLPAWAGTTDYRTYLNGAWVGNAQASPYTFIGADCGVSVTLGVQPYNETAGTGGPLYTIPFNTPICTVPPSNTSLPVISGSTVQGQTLSVTNGTWTGSPSGFSYEWQDCNTGGGSCVNIGGATSSTYTLQASDVGDTVDVIVTASNAYGSNSATAAYVGPVTGGGGQTLNCFGDFSNCGYPDPTTVGVTAGCSSLTTFTGTGLPSGATVSGSTVSITGNNVTLSGLNFNTYQINVSGTNDILNNDCVQWDGGGSESAYPVSANGSTNLTVENTTIVPAGCSSAYNVLCTNTADTVGDNIALGAGTIVNKDVLAGGCENMGMATVGRTVTIDDTYIDANGVVSGCHVENLYIGGGDTMNISGDTFLNPFNQTANLFGDTYLTASTCENNWLITNSFFAGAGFEFYQCSGAGSIGAATLTATGNDFARCTGGTFNTENGGQSCVSSGPDSNGSAIAGGMDTHGYWPNGGYFGIIYQPTLCSAGTWSGNFWDDNGATVSC